MMLGVIMFFDGALCALGNVSSSVPTFNSDHPKSVKMTLDNDTRELTSSYI